MQLDQAETTFTTVKTTAVVDLLLSCASMHKLGANTRSAAVLLPRDATYGARLFDYSLLQPAEHYSIPGVATVNKCPYNASFVRVSNIWT